MRILKNQSFKFHFKSKFGSNRIQTMVNGKFRNHLGNRNYFDDFVGQYELPTIHP